MCLSCVEQTTVKFEKKLAVYGSKFLRSIVTAWCGLIKLHYMLTENCSTSGVDTAIQWGGGG